MSIADTEKREYARVAVHRDVYGKYPIIDYRGKNIFKKVLRQMKRAQLYNKIMKDDKLYIKGLAVVTSHNCNLNCNGCGQHTPILKKSELARKDVDMEQIKRDLDKIAESVDKIGGISVASGEGFLNVHLSELIDYYKEHRDKYLLMNIPTNGTVVPDDALLRKMADNKVSCSITEYAAVPASVRKTFTDKLDENGIEYGVFESRKWFKVDYDTSLNASESTAKEKYKNCERYFMLIDGELWKCEVNVTGVKAGLRPKREGDYIVVKDATTEQVREFIKRKLNCDYLENCLYCRGVSGPDVIEIPAGEQIKQ